MKTKKEADGTTRKKVEKKEADERNIIFVSSNLEPFEAFNTATETIELPSAEEQIKGFYHERAGFIIRTFPNRYKQFRPKGKK